MKSKPFHLLLTEEDLAEWHRVPELRRNVVAEAMTERTWTARLEWAAWVRKNLGQTDVVGSCRATMRFSRANRRRIDAVADSLGIQPGHVLRLIIRFGMSKRWHLAGEGS